MAKPIIRRAEERDAARLGELAEQTFRDAFAAMNTPENMEHHCREQYGEAIQAREILDPSITTLICEDEGELVAYAQLRWGHAPEHLVAAHPMEIQRIYVVRTWHGRGLAQELMGEALRLAERGGADLVWLGVWELNPRAIAFYRKSGFEESGSHTFVVGDDPQRDVIMVRAVARG
ncbi:MAG: GNAT family N-acetyltransferase [Thermoanaerobaculia bacterium]|jgi:ribosomal protein S18 acetylase RimI-like enzyme